MQLYGYQRPTTPFISEWAKEAVVFKRFYSADNWTTPTTMSMMTGQRPWTHMKWHYLMNNRNKSEYENSLPMVLSSNGYDVYGFVQNSYAHPETLSISKSFLLKDKSYTFHASGQGWINRLESLLVNRPVVQEWIFADNPLVRLLVTISGPDYKTTLVPPDRVYDRFLEHISRVKKASLETGSRRPYFAWLHVFPPHAPYLPPAPFMGLFGDAGVFNTKKSQRESGLEFDYEPERQDDVDILRKRYDEFILYSDNEFKGFMKRLSETVDLSNTIVIFTSDHGESFSHGFVSHGELHLYEQLVRIPLVIKIPGEAKGVEINMPAEQVDLAPTILELAGIEVPDWMEGRSLYPLINGEKLDPLPLFSMALIRNKVLDKQPITKGTFAVWEGDYKLIYYLAEDRRLLFNLREDPGETEDLADKEKEIADRLQKIILENLEVANKKITGKG
jgi:arylsulfatase A-like enzyme